MNLVEFWQAIKDLYELREPEGTRWIDRDEVLSLLSEVTVEDVLKGIRCGHCKTWQLDDGDEGGKHEWGWGYCSNPKVLEAMNIIEGINAEVDDLAFFHSDFGCKHFKKEE